MITGRDIVIISSIDWHELWQSHHEIATRLARNGNRVVFLENLGIRMPRLRDARRLGIRVANRLGSFRSGLRVIEPNLQVCSTLILPPWGSRARRFLNRRLFIPMLRRTVDTMAGSRPIVWTFLPTDAANALAESIAGSDGIVVYYAVADFEELAPDRDSVRRSERSLVARADLVFANGEPVAKRLRQWRPDVVVMPVGVNVEAFQGEPAGIDPVDDARISEIRGPIIGYVGGLHRHVDFDLIAGVARLRPDWTWLLVGPSIESTSMLQDLENVTMFGRREHSELPGIIARFDVGVIPYLTGPSTRSVVPTKLNEYLACGRPVVSTRLPRSEEIAREIDDVTIAEANPADFAAAIERAIERASDEEAVMRRRAYATAHDWVPRLERMSEAIERMERRRLAGQTQETASK